MAVSREGLLDGAVLVTRMLVVVFLAAVLIATTRPAEIKAAVEWFLKPFPGIPAARIGTMLGLLLRFMPLIFLQAAKTRDAQRSRAIENRKNPFYRLTRFTLPFMRCAFESADRLALAMEARGYRDQRTPPRLSAGRGDWAVLALAMGASLLLWMF
jgi:energy-coupling factor transporter transmembrane protein EcfT